MKTLIESINEGSAKFDKKYNAIAWNGDKPCVAVINTADYPSIDGNVAVQICEMDELENAGFEEEEIVKIEKMKIGDTLSEFEYDGVVVVRLI